MFPRLSSPGLIFGGSLLLRIEHAQSKELGIFIKPNAAEKLAVTIN